MTDPRPPMNLLPTLPLVSDLPQVDGPARERGDAARNRRRILAATQALVSEHGPDAVSMDRIAEAAGVGKGTLFRRFGDRAGLLRALLSDREEAFQEELIRGAPPLGPGAPPRERLLAFGPAYLALLDDVGGVLCAVERALGTGLRLESPPYQLLRTHVALLVRAADETLDAGYVADLLLAPLSASYVRHQREALGMSAEQLADGWRTAVQRLLPER